MLLLAWLCLVIAKAQQIMDGNWAPTCDGFRTELEQRISQSQRNPETE